MILLSLAMVLQAWASTPVNIDEFKKIDSSLRRDQIISQAPPEQKEELIRIDTHLLLMQKYGEQGLEGFKRSELAKSRGFFDLEALYGLYWSLWDRYIIRIVEANENTHMAVEQRSAIGEKLQHEQSADAKRFEIIPLLLYHLTPSTQALQLEKKAHALRIEFARETGEDGFPQQSLPAITRARLTEAGQQMDQIVAELRTLPTLSSEQLQKEHDDFHEEELLRGPRHGADPPLPH